MLLERIYNMGTPQTKALQLRFAPHLRRVYPYVITGAYALPLMHQSSLGGLLRLAGDKINPLWLSPSFPLLYVLAAGVCGVGFVTFLVLIGCLRYARKLD